MQSGKLVFTFLLFSLNLSAEGIDGAFGIKLGEKFPGNIALKSTNPEFHEASFYPSKYPEIFDEYKIFYTPESKSIWRIKGIKRDCSDLTAISDVIKKKYLNYENKKLTSWDRGMNYSKKYVDGDNNIEINCVATGKNGTYQLEINYTSEKFYRLISEEEKIKYKDIGL